MARTLGNPTTASAVSRGGTADATGPATPPHAVRASRPGWRDPRLWVGIAIVAACIVAGARLIGAADDTVAVWAVKADAGPGASLSRGDLEAHRVHFASTADLAGYLRVDEALPEQLSLVRGVGRGELLPRAALASGTPTDTVQLPLSIDPGQVPPTVRSGSVVDVYVVGANGSGGSGGTANSGSGTGARSGAGADVASPALSAVTVVAAPADEDAFGGSQTKRQLTVAVPERRAQEFFGLLAGDQDPTITVVLRPAG